MGLTPDSPFQIILARWFCYPLAAVIAIAPRVLSGWLPGMEELISPIPDRVAMDLLTADSSKKTLGILDMKQRTLMAGGEYIIIRIRCNGKKTGLCSVEWL